MSRNTIIDAIVFAMCVALMLLPLGHLVDQKLAKISVNSPKLDDLHKELISLRKDMDEMARKQYDKHNSNNSSDSSGLKCCNPGTLDLLGPQDDHKMA